MCYNSYVPTPNIELVNFLFIEKIPYSLDYKTYTAYPLPSALYLFFISLFFVVVVVECNRLVLFPPFIGLEQKYWSNIFCVICSVSFENLLSFHAWKILLWLLNSIKRKMECFCLQHMISQKNIKLQEADFWMQTLRT